MEVVNVIGLESESNERKLSTKKFQVEWTMWSSSIRISIVESSGIRVSKVQYFMYCLLHVDSIRESETRNTRSALTSCFQCDMSFGSSPLK